MIKRMMFNVAFNTRKALQINALMCGVWFCSWLRGQFGMSAARDRLHEF
jgi:hypothetical protein